MALRKRASAYAEKKRAEREVAAPGPKVTEEELEYWRDRLGKPEVEMP